MARKPVVAETHAPLGVQPRQLRGREKRERLLAAAMKEYGRVGFDAARVENIVEAADTGWGTFFHYFPRKEDVLLAAAVEHQERVEAVVGQAIEDAGQPMIVHDVVRMLCLATVDTPYPDHLLAAMIRELLASPQRFAGMLGERRPFHNRITELLRIGQETGEVRTDLDAEVLGLIITTSILSIAARVGFSVPGERGLDEWVTSTFEVLWDGIATHA